jgi:hypothetical protein
MICGYRCRHRSIEYTKLYALKGAKANLRDLFKAPKPVARSIVDVIQLVQSEVVACPTLNLRSRITPLLGSLPRNGLNSEGRLPCNWR